MTEDWAIVGSDCGCDVLKALDLKVKEAFVVADEAADAVGWELQVLQLHHFHQSIGHHFVLEKKEKFALIEAVSRPDLEKDCNLRIQSLLVRFPLSKREYWGMFWWEKRVLLLLWILLAAVVSMKKVQYIVTLREQVAAAEREKVEELVVALGGRVTQQFSLIRAFVVQLDSEEKANVLRRCNLVEAVEADQVVKALEEPVEQDL